MGYDWKQDTWQVQSCDTNLDLVVQDELKFVEANTVLNLDFVNKAGTWGTDCEILSDNQVKVKHGSEPFIITRIEAQTVDGKDSLACSPVETDGAMAFDGLQTDGGSDSARTGYPWRRAVSMAGGITLGTVAGSLLGAPLEAAFASAGLAVLGGAAMLYFMDVANAGDPGTSWTAQGGGAGGSGSQSLTEPLSVVS